MSAVSDMRSLVSGVELIDASFAYGTGVIPLELPLLSGERTVLIDAGAADTPSTRIAPVFAARGRAISEVALVVNTHAHSDHIGGNAELRALAADVRVAVHRRDAAWAQDHVAQFNQRARSLPGQWDPSPAAEAAHYRLCGLPSAVDEYLVGGDVIEVGGGLDLVVIETHAHSPGHIALFNEHHGMLFTGDALQFDGVPVRGGPPIMPSYEDVDDYLQTLGRIAELEPAVLVTAHFGVIEGAAIAGALERCRAFVRELDAAVLVVLERLGAPAQLKAIVAGLHEDRPHWPLAFQLHHTTHGHLRGLAARGRVQAEAIDGIVHWKAAHHNR